jgi:hypothetical protein
MHMRCGHSSKHSTSLALLQGLPPEVAERVKAAQALANKMAAGSVPGAMPGMPGMAQPGIAGMAAAVVASMAPPGSAPPLVPGMPGALPPGVSLPLFPPQPAPAPAAPANPILAAAQAAAQRLAAQAGMPHLAAMQQLQAAAQQPVQLPPALLAAQQAAAAQAQAQAAATMTMRPPGMVGALKPEEPKKHFETELEINDFPQHARWKVGDSQAGWRAGGRAGGRAGRRAGGGRFWLQQPF